MSVILGEGLRCVSKAILEHPSLAKPAQTKIKIHMTHRVMNEWNVGYFRLAFGICLFGGGLLHSKSQLIHLPHLLSSSLTTPCLPFII